MMSVVGSVWEDGEGTAARSERCNVRAYRTKDVMDVSADDLDPQIRRFAAEMARAYAGYPDLGSVTLAEARQIAEAVRAPWCSGGPAMAATDEYILPTPHGGVRVRVYRPSPARDIPALLYLHGGGWTIFSIDTHDRIMREFAARAGIAVAGIDYALSPEAKYPVALEQVTAIARHFAQQGAQYGIDPARLAIGGDSAGGNLALAAALKLRDVGDRVFSGLLLLYGVFDKRVSPEAAARFGGSDYMLTAEEMAQFWANYLPDALEPCDTFARPLFAPLAGLPPVLLMAGVCDILAEQSRALAARLRAADVPADLKLYPGATHSFLEAVSISDLADRALADGALWLRSQLGAGAEVPPPVASTR